MTTSEKILSYLSDVGEEVRISDILEACDDAAAALLSLRRDDKVRLIPIGDSSKYDMDEVRMVQAALGSEQLFFWVELVQESSVGA